MLRTDFVNAEDLANNLASLDCDIMVAKPVQGAWSIWDIESSPLKMHLASFGAGSIFEGRMENNAYCFLLPLTCSSQCMGNGRPFCMDHVFVIAPGAPFCVTATGLSTWCFIFLPVDSLLSQGINLKLAHDQQADSYISKPLCLTAMRCRIVLAEFIKAASWVGMAEVQGMLKAVEKHIMALCREALTPTVTADFRRVGRPRASRQAIIERCKSCLDALSEDDIRLEDLRDAARVSERTMRDTFVEYSVCPLIAIWSFDSSIKCAALFAMGIRKAPP